MADEQRRLNPADRVRQRRAVVALDTAANRRLSRSCPCGRNLHIAFAIGFSSTLAAVFVGLIISFVLLAPSIVLGYAVKAAEREDLETITADLPFSLLTFTST